MYAIGRAASLLGVSIKTLRRWAKHGKIRCIRTVGGHRRFSLTEIERLKDLPAEKREKPAEASKSRAKDTCVALYGRVSSHKQKKRGDLKRQLGDLTRYCAQKKWTIVKVYKDVGSGLNMNRRGLWSLIKGAKHGKFSRLLISYKDRLTRFGFLYLKNYLSEFGVQITILNTLEHDSPQSELVEDLIAIIHSFSGKMDRMRRDH